MLGPSPLHTLLKRVLQEYHVPVLVSKGYQSIERNSLKAMLHVQTDRQLIELLEANFTVEGEQHL